MPFQWFWDFLKLFMAPNAMNFVTLNHMNYMHILNLETRWKDI